jgi:hypothetical protein
MNRFAWTAIASAVWGIAGVAAALAAVQVLAPSGVTHLFLALAATTLYAGVTEIGARRGPDPARGSLVEAAAAGLIQFLGVWALLAVGGPWAGHASVFLAAPSFHSYAAVALGGAFAVSLMLRALSQRRPRFPARVFLQFMVFWVSPFFGFFSPAVAAGMSVSAFGGMPTGVTGLSVAAGMVAASLAGRLLADWLGDTRR